MTKKEKIASISVTITLFLLIISCWYTIFQMRPDYIFTLQEQFNKIKYIQKAE